jgi:hypothetical protein
VVVAVVVVAVGQGHFRLELGEGGGEASGICIVMLLTYSQKLLEWFFSR